MLKETSYVEKYRMMQDWTAEILNPIRKDLKEHLKTDYNFLKTRFSGKNIQKIAPEEFAEVYGQALKETESEKLGEYVANRWLLKHTEIYYFFEEWLTKMVPNFTDLDVLDAAISKQLIKEAVTKYGAPNTYIFSVLNSVVYPKEVYDELAKLASKTRHERKQEIVSNQEKASVDELKRSHELEITRLTDKYEKKLLGLQKKYTQDVEALKKQIVQLQKRLG